MKNQSSNNLVMNTNLNLLNSIKKLEVPEYLLYEISKRIMESRVNKLKPQWAVGIAAAVLLVIGIEAVSIKNRIHSEKKQLVETMLPIEKYNIYE